MHTEQTSQRELTYSQAILEGLRQCMEQDSSVIVIGEGVPDPKAIFGTTEGLLEQFGPKRVFDMPLAENGMTGICIGAALDGLRPVMVHQRIDFSLLALDQIINNAAKWHYMFDGAVSVPLVIRVLIGRGWGQGPQHSQSLQALFAHIPGLKVVMPTTARDAKGLLIAAIKDNNPVIFIEHRWLHHIRDHVPANFYSTPLDQARVVRKGNDVTVVASSYMSIEVLKTAQLLADYGIDVEVIDLRSVRPIDIDTIIHSVNKTKHLMVTDTGWLTGGVTAEIIAQVVERAFQILQQPPVRIASPDHPVPTSHFMADDYYPEAETIAERIIHLLGKSKVVDIATIITTLRRPEPRDVPYQDFHGPF
ncbi:pyruvate dehydrogenase, E1 component, beta subunit [Beggiatoa sp. PS]|nr:pyruvate dehydrogenase, E1 component, beta subunit [Beggiatoa sp. PS]